MLRAGQQEGKQRARGRRSSVKHTEPIPPQAKCPPLRSNDGTTSQAGMMLQSERDGRTAGRAETPSFLGIIQTGGGWTAVFAIRQPGAHLYNGEVEGSAVPPLSPHKTECHEAMERPTKGAGVEAKQHLDEGDCATWRLERVRRSCQSANANEKRAKGVTTGARRCVPPLTTATGVRP